MQFWCRDAFVTVTVTVLPGHRLGRKLALARPVQTKVPAGTRTFKRIDLDDQ